MTCGVRALFTLAALLTAGPAVLAHHSFAAQYDSNKPVTLTGTVTKMEWASPHIYFYIDVKDDGGRVANWAIEGGAPPSLYRLGWRRDSLKIGDVVTIQGFHARDGSNLANMRSAVLADGRRVFSGQPDGRPEATSDQPPTSGRPAGAR